MYFDTLVTGWCRSLCGVAVCGAADVWCGRLWSRPFPPLCQRGQLTKQTAYSKTTKLGARMTPRRRGVA